MKWFECVEDGQDGTYVTRRFRSKESAEQWLKGQKEEWNGYEDFDCYPLGELYEVDTDSSSFWDDE